MKKNRRLRRLAVQAARDQLGRFTRREDEMEMQQSPPTTPPLLGGNHRQSSTAAAAAIVRAFKRWRSHLLAGTLALDTLLLFLITAFNGGGGMQQLGNNSTCPPCAAPAEMQLPENNDKAPVDCRPVWIRGPMRHIYLCRFPPASPIEERLLQHRRAEFFVRIDTGDVEDSTAEFLRDNHRRFQESPAATAGFRNYPREIVDELRASSLALESVINGSSCLISERQFKSLVEQRPWIELSFFERKTERK